MKNILLSVMFAAVEGAANVPEGLLPKLGYGLQIAAVGILIVFSVLAIIMGVLYVFEYFFYTLPNKAKKAPEAPKAVPVRSEAPAATLPSVSADNDEEIAVVIAAAVAAYYEQAAPTSKYRIKSFRRI